MSDRLNKELIKAPVTNPICTDIVSHAIPESLKCHSTEREGTTAEAENQSPIASNSAIESVTKVLHSILLQWIKERVIYPSL